ncbi:MAG: gephyrin-like molybdotransferase Glp [Qingshengfaniella sp.]
MISVDQALTAIFELITPLPSETVTLRQACGRVLTEDAVATRDQPPFPSSAMDGYAVRDTDVAPGARLTVIGEAAAGHRFSGPVGPGQAVRIFTGAPVPAGADRIVIQEDVIRDGPQIRIGEAPDTQAYIRPAGGDFRAGTRLVAGRRLRPADISLLASMNVNNLRVARRPVVAILGTGDELVAPGETPGPDQIVSSNGIGLAALVEAEGASARILPIARDTVAALRDGLALARGADLIVTSGGASVGDHDLIANAAEELGLERQFYKVAMRPGKPLMAGRHAGIPLIGLPGNPVSTMVCGSIFILPALRAMMSLPAVAAPRHPARLAHPLSANGPREHYMRARTEADGTVRAFDRQDSSLQNILSQADALIVRPPGDRARKTGESIEIVPI